MEIDARINAVRPKVAAARKMISQLTPRNEDQRRKIQAAENLRFVRRIHGLVSALATCQEHDRAQVR